MKIVHAIAFVLVIVGALNWGLVAVAEWNLVNILVGKWMWLERAVYVLVGLSAVYLAVMHKKDCKHCESSGAPAQV